MSSEITIRHSISVAHGGVTFSGDITKTFDIAASGFKHATVQALTTSAENVDIGSDLTWSTVSFLWIKNQSSTSAEIISIIKDGEVVAEIPAGATQPICCPQDGVAFEAQSASGTPSMQVIAVAAA